MSEMQLFAIDGVRQVKKLLNGLVLAVAVDDITLKDFARRSHANPSMVARKLLGALEVLSGHCSSPGRRGRARHDKYGPIRPRSGVISLRRRRRTHS